MYLYCVLDVKKTGIFGRDEVVTHNATRRTGKDPVDFARFSASLGAGEILLNSVDRDGTRQGYDLDLIARVKDAINIPMTVLGGAGDLADIGRVFDRFGTIGAAAGSMFVFKGRFRAVLIQYPSLEEHDELCRCGGIRLKSIEHGGQFYRLVGTLRKIYHSKEATERTICQYLNTLREYMRIFNQQIVS